MKYLFMLVLLIACETSTHKATGQYAGTRDSGNVVIVKETDWCSSSAFDNSTCEYTHYCVDTSVVPKEIQNRDIIRMEECYYTLQDALKHKGG